MRRVRLKIGSDNPANLSMLLHSFSYKCNTAGNDEVPFQPLPHKVKFISPGPHIRTRSFDGVLLRNGIVASYARPRRVSNIRLAHERADRFLLRRRNVSCKKNVEERHNQDQNCVLSFHSQTRPRPEFLLIGRRLYSKPELIWDCNAREN